MQRENDKLKPSIGFIGMGHMGSHMAQRLLDAGYQVTVYDRTHEKAQEVGQRGAHVAQAPKELAVNCQVMMACVTDDQAQGQQAIDFVCLILSPLRRICEKHSNDTLCKLFSRKALDQRTITGIELSLTFLLERWGIWNLQSCIL